MDLQTVPTNTESPSKSLSSLIQRRRSRRSGEANSSNVSIASDEQAPKDSGSSFKATIDRGIDKLKERRRSSIDVDALHDATSPPSRRLSKLVPLKSLRRGKNAFKASSEDLEAVRGREGPAVSSTLLTSEDASTNDPNGSTDSLGRARSVGSSLLTEDSDAEPDRFVASCVHVCDSRAAALTEADRNRPPLRPTLSSRQSHKGYLTLSSPLISAETVQVIPTGLTGAQLAALDRTALPSQPNITSPQISLSGEPGHDVGNFVGVSAGDPTTVHHKGSDVADAGEALISDPSDTIQTPSTVVTPPTPDFLKTPAPLTVPAAGSRPANTTFTRAVASKAPVSQLSSSTTFNHRRTRSTATTSSKIYFPLSPAIEEAKTPGGTLVQPSGSPAGGFFSSFISATQNAVNTLSGNLTSPAGPFGQRSRSGTDPKEIDSANAVDKEEVIVTNIGKPPVEESEPAIKTLGTGDLSLSHLGIESDADSMGPRSVEQAEDQSTRPERGTRDTSAMQSDEASAAEAVSAAYADNRSIGDADVKSETNSVLNRPRSMASINPALNEDNSTPPRSMAAQELEDILNQRSGSVRSRISDKKKRRHRGSSATTAGTTGGAIAAALGASHAALANPAGKGPGRRPTGFAIASSKRNKDFHALFKSVPEDDFLVEDYSAALQRDILLHGRMYVSERHVCFSSNILGWVTSLVIHFDEIVSLEKKSTAVIFPNAIVIQTLHAKNVFASFISRDSTYDLLLGIWRIGHPNLKTTEIGHMLDTSPQNEQVDANASDSDAEVSSEESDEYYDEEADEQDLNGSFVDADASIENNEAPETIRGTGARQVSAGPSVVAAANGSAVAKTAETHDAGGSNNAEFPGPPTHTPTECTDQDTHYDKEVLDTTIPAPVGKVYSMMFGPSSGAVMRKFLLDDQKSGDLQMEDDKKGMGEDVKSCSYSFIKQLNGSIGPKQTKCVVTQTLDHFELERSVSVTCSTQTPDVPSGNSFVTKTKYCLMWGPANSTRLLMSSTVEWSAKSWLKMPIEKGASDGQVQYGKDLSAFLKAQCASRSPVKASKGKGKGRRKRTATDGTGDNESKQGGTTDSPASNLQDTGFLQSIKNLLEPAGGMFGALLSTTGILVMLLLLVTTMLLRQSFAPTKAGVDRSLGANTAQRLAAYENVWMQEENELWNWLEDRLNLDDLYSSAQSNTAKSRKIESRLSQEKMSERQLDAAVRTMEERLGSLKKATQHKRKHDHDTETLAV